MKRHHNKVYVIPPHWAALVLCAVAIVISGTMWAMGITSERVGLLEPQDLFFLSILSIIAQWKSLHLSQTHVKVYRCSILCRRIHWTDIERLEILSRARDCKYLLFELHGCPSCPKNKTSLYFWKNPKKLIRIKLTPNKEDEQIKSIEGFHPIDASIVW